MQDYIAMHSAISSKVLQHSLWKGIGFALIGLVLILYNGIFGSLTFLSNWGWLIFLTGGTLITYGMLQYRKLAQRQLHPHVVHLTSVPHQLQWYIDEHQFLNLPSTFIASIAYKNDKYHYGIIIYLKEPNRSTATDLFLPYFSKHAFETLLQWLQQCYD